MLGPAVLTAAVMAWELTAPSFWRDEAATLSATRRSFGELLHMLQSVDLVHFVYYVTMWPVVHIFGGSELALRLPSALAMSATAYGVTWLGRELLSLRAGVCAGMFFALMPTVSKYGQQGRSAAFAVAFAVLATGLLIVAIRGDGKAGNIRRYGFYSLALVLLLGTSITNVLLLPAHAAFVFAGAGAARRAALLNWGRAVACAAVPVLPLAIFSWTQRSALAWIPDLGASETMSFLFDLLGSATLALPALFILAAGIKRINAGGDRFPEVRTPLLLWLLLPGSVLFLLSVLWPMFLFRYVACCLPVVALLCGHGIARSGSRAVAVALPVVVLTAAPSQAALRQAGGRGGDDLRRLSSALAAHKRPGDGILYVPAYWRHLESAYPAAFTGLTDVAERTSPVRAGNLHGTEVSPGLLRTRAGGVDRLWIVGLRVPNPGDAKQDAAWAVKNRIRASPAFRTAGVWRSRDLEIRLLTRRSTTTAQGETVNQERT